jgi:hypothetical protein
MPFDGTLGYLVGKLDVLRVECPSCDDVSGRCGCYKDADRIQTRGAQMASSEEYFGNFSRWTDKKLADAERQYTAGDLRGEELRAEMNRLRGHREQRYTLWATVAAAISALGSMIAAIASLLTLRH